MDVRETELPILNYLWVGPPNRGNEVKDVIDMAARCQNPVCYYCLDEYADYYKELFEKFDTNISVKSIDKYLHDSLSHEDTQMQSHAKKMIQIRQEVLTPPRDRIIDRVSFKDAFSLFLLANQGGYTLDINVRLANDVSNIAFASYDHIQMPFIDSDVECWMMYASPHAKNEAKLMLNYYMNDWDSVQRIITGYEKDFHSVLDFHNAITGLIIDSVRRGRQWVYEYSQPDSGWEFTLESSQDGTQIAQMAGIPVEKKYTGGHKPEYECREIVESAIRHYDDNNFAIYFAERENLVSNLLKEMSRCKTLTDFYEIFDLSDDLNSILNAAMELDSFALDVSRLSSNYRSKSGNSEKMDYSYQINEMIDQGYAALNDRLNKTISTAPQKIIQNVKHQVRKIGSKAVEHHEKTHRYTSLFRKSRFETLKDISDKPNNTKQRK